MSWESKKILFGCEFREIDMKKLFSIFPNVNAMFLNLLLERMHANFSIVKYVFKLSEAKAMIVGPDEKYIKAGSSLQIVCRFENVTQTPETVFW